MMKKQRDERVIMTTCASHCGGTCLLKVHVEEGVITRIETDDGEEPQLRACCRGRAYRQRVYANDRLKFPLKRVGERGAGRFERISWNEALDIVSRELKKVRDIYGPASIVYLWSAGDISQLHNSRQFHRLLVAAGGYTRVWGVWSYQGGVTASQTTYGTWRTGNSRDDLLNSRLIILWGWNPANTVGGTNTSWYLAQAKEVGTKIIAVDPRYTDTAAAFAAQWIPIRPSTDTAMLLAMAFTIINEDRQDQVFLNKYTIGFDRFRDYVLGIEDGQAKTPEWAEKITGVPAQTIRNLAREYATLRPAALMSGVAPGRTAYGEQYHRATITLAAMTGNIGIHGGDAAGRAWESGSWYPYKMPYGLTPRPEDGENPLEKVASDGQVQLYVSSKLHYTELPDCILKGREGGFAADLKLAFIVNHNYLNQNPNINKIIAALKKLEFIVVLEQFMTPTARFADIILPTATFLERNDIDFGVGTPFYGFVSKVIEPVGECKSHLDIARALANKMGILDYDEVTEDKLLRKEVAGSEIPDYEEFKNKGIYRFALGEPYVAFKKQIENPTANPFGTPSGKIEIYSEAWANASDPELPPIAKYIQPWEGPNDPQISKYPLQLITTHFKRRALSQYENIPWLKELEPQAILINPIDAKVRGISTDDSVRVYNGRGQLLISAKVTERIMPGVVDIPHGSWYNADGNGVDIGGNPNVLTNDRFSPGGAFPFNTCLVEVQKNH